MEHKEHILKTMSKLETAFIIESINLADELAKGGIGYRELLDLQQEFTTRYMPNISKELFERVKEDLLNLKLGI